MPKLDKKETKADKKEKEDKRIYLDEDQPKLTEMIVTTSKSTKKVGKAEIDTRLKDIVEKAKENDPTKSRTPNIFQYKPLNSESEKGKTNKIETTQKVSEHGKDEIRLILFVGVILGFLILISLFGGPYSPLVALGFISKPNVSTASSSTPVVIPVVENTTLVSTPEVPEPEVKIPEPTKVDITISNWRMEPSQITAKVGEKLVLQITAKEMPFKIIIEGLSINRDIDAGQTISIEVTPETAGSYTIHAMASSAGRVIEATGTLVAE